MANHWSVTCFAALALLCCLTEREAEAQNTKNPQYPQPQYPQPQPQPPQYPKYPPSQLEPQPQYPQPQYPQPQYPQPQPQPQPQYPQPQPQPQYPQPQPQPQYPQPPQYPKYPPSQPQPQYPQPQPQPQPQYPQPHPQPQYPQPQPQYPQPPEPQPPKYPYPPPPPKYPYPPPPQNPENPPKVWSSDQGTKVPVTSPQKPQTPVLPPPAKTCDVDKSVRVPCGVSGISATDCQARDCCFDGQSCYFGTGVTLQCTKDGHFIVVVARDVTVPHIDLESISLLGDGQNCKSVDSNSAFAIYFFPVTACGTVATEEPGAIIYQNKMVSSYEVGVGPHGSITRDSSYELVVQCKYHGTSVESVVVEVLPLDNPPLPVAALGPINVMLRLANGLCMTKGCNEDVAAYTSYYQDSDYPVTKVLRDPVYVEVLLLDKTDPHLVLTLGHCWATSSPEPHSLPQWDILINGCPYADDRYLSSLVPVDSSSGVEFPTHYRRFLFKMFTFVNKQTMEPLNEHVYIHCSTSVCVPGPGVSCEPSCSGRKGKRDTEAAEKKDEPKVVVSSGKMIISAASEQ